jgi:myosin-5
VQLCLCLTYLPTQPTQWSFIDFPDNKSTLELIEAKHSGMLDLMDEECLFPKGCDSSLASKLNRACSPHPCFSVSKKQLVKEQFEVRRYTS